MTLTQMLMLMSGFKSEKRSNDSGELRHVGNGDGKIDLQGRWLVERRPLRSKSWYTSEKRHSRRYCDCQKVFCHPVGSHSFNAQVIDASLGGLRIKTDALLTIDSWLSLVLKIGEEIGLFFVKILWQGKRQDSYDMA